MLKMTGAMLKIILDVEMHLKIKKGIRGRETSYTAKLNSRENNRFVDGDEVHHLRRHQTNRQSLRLGDEPNAPHG